MLRATDSEMLMKRILVVDDNTDILQIVKIILENNGFEVVVTPNGEETLLKTETFHPQLILMDVFLSSGIDGREICKTLKVWQRKSPRLFSCARLYCDHDPLARKNY